MIKRRGWEWSQRRQNIAERLDATIREQCF
jgi:hypothetical protein